MDRAAQWRQLLDLLAQRRPGADPELARKALGRLQELRAGVPVSVRTETARAFAGRPVPAPLVVFLAADVPPVAGALLGQVRLSRADWLAVLPRLSPTGRGFLRHRRDLDHAVTAALATFGAADLALAGEVAPAIATAGRGEAIAAAPDPGLAPGGGEGQIRAIISRIEQFRERRDVPMPAPAETPVQAFRFETGADGIICWTDGEPRGALIGLHVFNMAGAQTDAVLLHRSAFRDRRLDVPGRSAVAGRWLLSAVPVFTPAEGRFLGFRGTALRDTAAEDGAAGRLGIGPDSLRQLVHELRTPLNAIGGFGEMIRRQMRGPVSVAYRQRAELIVELAGRLLAAVDDLDVAARLETDRLDLQRLEVDLAAMIDGLCSHYRQSGARDGFALDRRDAASVPPVAGDPGAVRRIVDRVIAAATALAGRGETIRLELAPVGAAGVELAVGRPQRLAGHDAETLLDPSFAIDGGSAEAPPLGLGFSLFLVRRLARAMGGGFSVDADHFRLHLPIASAAPRAEAV